MKTILVAFFTFIVVSVYSQDYVNAIGLRGGITQGLTYKQFFTSNDAVDFIGSFYLGGMNFTALYERHKNDIFEVDNFAFFYGIGAHVGLFDGDRNHRWFTDSSDWTSYHVVVGVDFVVGVEYSFDEIPLSLSIDVIPSINVLGHLGYWQRGAISVRYIIGNTNSSF